ncbi:MAG: hypothetical protein D6753_08150 [Planctomycetota bacterium]|nr:MAG: hypothetical protein D6753_08150 [Planctomycetota bacterium]
MNLGTNDTNIAGYRSLTVIRRSRFALFEKIFDSHHSIPNLDLNQGLNLQRVPCNPLHHGD